MKIPAFVEEIFDLSNHVGYIALDYKSEKIDHFGGHCAHPKSFFLEGPICMGGPRWFNFQEQLRKKGFAIYKKK